MLAIIITIIYINNKVFLEIGLSPPCFHCCGGYKEIDNLQLSPRALTLQSC